MRPASLDPATVRNIVVHALGEDIGPADITTLAVVDETIERSAHIVTKEEGTLCGISVADAVFREVDASLQLEKLCEDGDKIVAGDTILHIHGRAHSILTAERTALNFLQHLSGIATETARYVAATEGTQAKILDTRKTIPGLRTLQKYAVSCGGGVNHRMGLYDEFLIKDNHLALMKSKEGKSDIAKAVRNARRLNPKAKLTVEADTLEQVAELVKLKVDQILLDNMSDQQIAEAVKIAAGKCPLEASGNMTPKRIPSVAATGVDFISVGALTHHIRALDFSLEMQEILN